MHDIVLYQEDKKNKNTDLKNKEDYIDLTLRSMEVDCNKQCSKDRYDQ